VAVQSDAAVFPEMDSAVSRQIQCRARSDNTRRKVVEEISSEREEGSQSLRSNFAKFQDLRSRKTTSFSGSLVLQTLVSSFRPADRFSMVR
jgi:hypothetical protein